MSSNAYEALNQFISQFLICLVSESCKAMQSDQVNFAGQSPTFGPVNVSWSYIIMAIKAVAPSIEPWFSTWYKQLSEHVNIAHSNDLPGMVAFNMPLAKCCMNTR